MNPKILTLGADTTGNVLRMLNLLNKSEPVITLNETEPFILSREVEYYSDKIYLSSPKSDQGKRKFSLNTVNKGKIEKKMPQKGESDSQIEK